VLALLAAGKSNKEIADKLGISPNTVKTQSRQPLPEARSSAPHAGGPESARTGAYPLSSPCQTADLDDFILSGDGIWPP
jgi:hypothetical protein